MLIRRNHRNLYHLCTIHHRCPCVLWPVRENVKTLDGHLSPPARLNEAPAGCRGRLGHFSGNSAFIKLLQWGPGRMPGKTRCRGSQTAPGGYCFNGAPAGCRGRPRAAFSYTWFDKASMGPRQDAGEDAGVCRAADLVSRRFNGAPAGCRGRPDQPTPGIKALGMLQWGPGRMPGKTERNSRAPVAGFCFNGAPAGCRGRLPIYVESMTSAMSFNGAPAGCRGRQPLSNPAMVGGLRVDLR